MSLHPKVAAGGAAGALATVILALAAASGAHISQALAASIATLVILVAGYLKTG